MEKSEYSKKLNERKKSDDAKNKIMVKTGCYKKDDKYYVVFYTGVKDFKVKDYVKSLGGKYRPDLNHVDEDGKTLSSKKCHGWLVDPEILKVEHLNNLIEYGTDNESLLKTLQSQNIDYDPDKPKKSPERQTMTPPQKDNLKESKTHTYSTDSTDITIHIKNSSNETISTIKCSILSKINEYNYITDMGEIFKTSSGWQFVSPLKISIELNTVNNNTVNNSITEHKQDSRQLTIPKESVFLGGLTNAYSELKNLVLNSESPDCEDDDD
jgi:hypothetical protein